MDLAWISNHWGQIAAVWLLVEQILADTSLKSNSTFRLVCNSIDGLLRIFTPKTKIVAADNSEIPDNLKN